MAKLNYDKAKSYYDKIYNYLLDLQSNCFIHYKSVNKKRLYLWWTLKNEIDGLPILKIGDFYYPGEYRLNIEIESNFITFEYFPRGFGNGYITGPQIKRASKNEIVFEDEFNRRKINDLKNEWIKYYEVTKTKLEFITYPAGKPRKYYGDFVFFNQWIFCIDTFDKFEKEFEAIIKSCHSDLMSKFIKEEIFPFCVPNKIY